MSNINMLKIPKYSYKTRMGYMLNDDSLQVLSNIPDNKINLVITSPPFPLLRKKEYGNKKQSEYIDWLLTFAKLVFSKLTPDGSFVIDLGGVYKKGVPVRSLYNFRLLIKICDEIGFNLAEEFYWYNPSKLPSPIEWVNKRKIRVKDSVNTVWWLSKTTNPKSDVSKVLVPYSERMKKLIESPSKFYKPKLRPSGHNIGSNFSIDNGGAIPSNLLNIPNSESNSLYFRRCKAVNIKTHPARFPEKLPEFFIKMLTDEGDLIIDIFAGSNTTGLVAEKLQRNWVSIENRLDYVSSSIFRFIDESFSSNKIIEIYNLINDGRNLDVSEYQPAQSLFDVNNKNLIYTSIKKSVNV